MARANTRTWLSLDRWAEILGFNPLNFNQLDYNVLKPATTCGHMFFQYSWQNADRLGREDIAFAIRDAERMIANRVGYNLIPDWTTQERKRTVRPGFPGLYNTTGLNTRGQQKSITANKGHLISGGVQVKTGIETVAIVYSDEDGDGYDETATVTVATSVTDSDELRIYYPSKEGSDKWEIRPIEIDLDTVVAQAVITFKAWQVVIDAPQQDTAPEALDPTDATNYLTEVDVYRVYNDPQTQVQFLWESDSGLCSCNTANCTACQFGTQLGCLHIRDPRLGMFAYAPATWNAATSTFTNQDWAVCREPDQVRLYYYSGNEDLELARPRNDMEPFWEYAVAYLAAALLDRPVCGCSNVESLIERWQRDRTETTAQGSTFVHPAETLNTFGTTEGAKYAWQRTNMEGRRIAQ